MNSLRRLPRDAATRVRWKQQAKVLWNRQGSSTGWDTSSTFLPQSQQLSLGYDNLRSFSTSTKQDEVPAAGHNPQHDAVISHGKTRLLASALQGDAPDAQQILEQLESFVHSIFETTNSTQEASQLQEKLLECRQAVLDAWIAHQDKLVIEWEALKDVKNRNDHEKERFDDQRKILEHQIFHAANNAHQALENSVPFLMRPALAVASKPQPRTTPNKHSSKGDHEEEDLVEILEDTPLGSPLLSAKNKTTQAAIRHRCNAVLSAWAKASRVAASRKTNHRGIPQRATYLVQRMEASGTDTAPMTSTESYNQVLAAWAWSREHLRATMAEQTFLRMWKTKHAKPNGESYRWIIQAWCWSGQKKAAFNATGHLMKVLRRIENRRESVEPLPETYHMVMKAWTTAGDRNAPMKASSLLRIMEYAHAMGFCSVPVDETVYRYYLMALSRWSVVPEQGPLADQVINKLKERQIVPDTVSYGAAIRTHKNSARNRLFAMGREASITRAVELLEEVSLAHHRSALVSVKAETRNYNDVLEALASSGKDVSKDIAETLVKVMEVSPEEEDIRPNAESYRWLLAVHAHSKALDKVESARNALARMKASIAAKDADHESEHGEAVVAVYNAFLEVCASVPENPANPTELLQESLEAVEELKSLYSLRPDPRTYANLLEVCKTHVSLGAERDRIVESIFGSCRNEGLVDSRVLRALKAVTSEELYMEMVISHSTVEDGIRMVPESWTTRGVGVQRVVSADGRKAVPLSVDGRFTVTKAMKEYRMRKLRSHVNRNVLHGGRRKLSKKEMGEYIHIRLDEP